MDFSRKQLQRKSELKRITAKYENLFGNLNSAILKRIEQDAFDATVRYIFKKGFDDVARDDLRQYYFGCNVTIERDFSSTFDEYFIRIDWS
jgi:hypothetical protein